MGPMLDGLDDGEEFALSDGVVTLGRVEASTVVGDDAFRAVIIHLFQACSNSDASGGVSGDGLSLFPMYHKASHYSP